MGIDFDPDSVGRPSTSADGPGDPPGGEKLFPGRGGLGEGLCIGNSRLVCVEGQSGQIRSETDSGVGGLVPSAVQLDDPEWNMDPSEGSLQGGTGRAGSVVSQCQIETGDTRERWTSSSNMGSTVISAEGLREQENPRMHYHRHSPVLRIRGQRETCRCGRLGQGSREVITDSG